MLPDRRSRRSSLTLGLCAGLALSTIANAGLDDHPAVPAVLDWVPTDTALLVAIPNLQSLVNDVTAFTAANGDKLPANISSGLAQVGVLQLLLSQPGVDAEGSAAIVLYPEPDAAPGQAPEMDGVGVLPITNFAQFSEAPFVSSQGAEMNGGVLELDFFGESVFLRDLDGFVVVGADRDLVTNFEGARGQLAAHADRLGAAGKDLSGSSDAMVIANIEALAPAMKQGLGDLEEQAQMLAAMGGGPAVNDAVAELRVVAQNFLRDASAGFVGLDVSGEGVAMDLSAQFKDQSELGKMFDKSGDADELVDNLPRMDFLFAGAVDLNNPGLRALADGMTDFNEKIQAGLAAQIGGEAPTLGFEAFESASGFSGAIGTAPALGGGGLFANSVMYYRVDDTNKTREALRDGILEANGAAAAGVKYSTTYERNAQRIGGASADEYAVTTEMDPNAGGGMASPVDPAMIQQMMFGFTGGPNGFIADADEGLFMTASKNSQLLERTINAANGTAPALDSADLFKLTRSQLPSDASAQIYIAADQIANTVGPFLVMFGAGDGFEPAAAMAPIGMGITTGDGAFAVRAFVPGDVLTFLAQFASEEDLNPGGPAQDRPPF
ncbi:MAG: hypothetical protein AAGI53_15110 [Planctomycetota bacterium]